ncbi:MAG: ABC transporter substrate-binding protein [Thainema sp.]
MRCCLFWLRSQRFWQVVWQVIWPRLWTHLGLGFGMLVLAVGLLGCQSGPTDTARIGSPNGDSEVVHLTLWQGISPPSNRDVFQSLVEQFNQAHPYIEVESLYIGQPDQQIPKILTGVVGGASPDILWYIPTFTGQLVELEAILPLDNWLQENQRLERIIPALHESMLLEDHYWSVPFGTNNVGVFYRPSLFEEAGITRLPRTWSEFAQVVAQLTRDRNGDGFTDQYGLWLSLGKGEWNVFVYLPFVYSASGEIVQNGQPDLTNEGAIAALEFASSLVQDGVVQLSPPERGYETDSFMSGQVAMQFTGPWNIGQFEESGVDYDVFPLPMRDQPAAVVGGENFFVMKTTSEREQAALEFLDFVISESFQTEWALKTGYLPINPNVLNSPDYQAFVAENPALQMFLQQMEWARSRPLIPGYRYLSENFGRAIEASLLGEPPAEALTAAQRRLELILGSDQ